MKLTKKIIVAALAVVGLTFAGCNMNLDKHNMIDFDAPGNCATIDFTNETESMQRGWKTFNSAHKTGTCVIELDNSKGNGGNMGFIWGLENGPDNTCNFYVATLNYGNQSNGDNYGCYVSYYEGVGKAYLEGTSSNFCDKDGNEITKTANANGAKETPIIPDSGTWKSLPTIKDEGKVAFVLTWTQGTGYTIGIYHADDVNANGNPTSLPITSKASFATGLSDSEIASSDAPDKGLGVYAMSNKGKTLKGRWDFPGFSVTSAVVEE